MAQRKDDVPLQKIAAIAKINTEIIERIKQQTGRVTVGHSYTFRVSKGQEISNPKDIQSVDGVLEIQEQEQKEEVSSIISSWFPSKQLEAVEDFFNDHIDYSCKSFEDVIRLNKDMPRVAQKYKIFDCTQTALDVIQRFLTSFEIIQTFLGEIETSLQPSPSSLKELKIESDVLKQEVLKLSKKVEEVNLKEEESRKKRALNMTKYHNKEYNSGNGDYDSGEESEEM